MADVSLCWFCEQMIESKYFKKHLMAEKMKYEQGAKR